MSAERLMTQLEMMTSTELSGRGMCSISPLRNSTLVSAGFALVFAGECEHFVGHVEPVGFAGGAYAASGEENVDAAAGAEIENSFAGVELGESSRVAAAERGENSFFR